MACIVGRPRYGNGFLFAATLLVLIPGFRAGAEADTAGGAPAEAAASAGSEPIFDPLPLIGLELAAAFGSLGAPQEVFPFEQTVVFYYPDHKYLFWFKNRVWQVRVDKRYGSSAMGFRMGELKAETTARIGRPFKDLGDAVSFRIEAAGFPLEARLVFEDGRLSDFYVYRSDW